MLPLEANAVPSVCFHILGAAQKAAFHMPQRLISDYCARVSSKVHLLQKLTAGEEEKESRLKGRKRKSLRSEVFNLFQAIESLKKKKKKHPGTLESNRVFGCQRTSPDLSNITQKNAIDMPKKQH